MRKYRRNRDADVVSRMLRSRNGRIALFENDLELFGEYYFPHLFTDRLAEFQKQWLRSMSNMDVNTYIEAFRGSGKTIDAVILVAWCICFKKRRYIMPYTYEKKKATANLYGLATQLMRNKKLIADF